MKRGISAAVSRTLVAALLAGAVAGTAFAGSVGFEEDFALALDRTIPLKQLIPGTEDFYYYTALQAQNQGDLAAVDKTLAAWIKQHNRTPRVQEMENRQALLKYASDSKTTLAYLSQHLGLYFNHEKETLARQAALPTALDPKSISRETLTANALARNPQTLGGFEDSALEWLSASDLSDERLHELLSRLQRPDVDNLPKLIIRDLATRYGTGFGSLTIHRNLLLAQLDELLKLQPNLLNDTNLVNIYLTKLRPAVGVDWRHDPKEQAAYLDRLWSFVAKLGPMHNSLKAHILYQRLTLDRKLGLWDKDHFTTYLQLPRPVWYINPKYLEPASRRDYQVNLSADYSAITLFPPIREDEPLMRSYLLHFLTDAPDFEEYKPLLESTYLQEAFAEAKITSGVGDQEKWFTLLPAEKLQALKDRVDVDFAYTNKDLYGPDDAVSVDVALKNVKTLIVKVYQLNAANFYQTNKREVNTDINLDGLVANEERTIEYTDSPLRRIDRHFDFPKLSTRGVYVIELIGNGKSSRALVRKGKLRYLERQGAAGQSFVILDEANQRAQGATLWMAGHDYTPGKDGLITVPYSTNPQAEPIVLQTGDFASLDSFNHKSEAYRFSAGLHVPREALIRYGTATVAIRPALYLNDTLISPKLLEEVTLVITSVDQDGIATSKEVPNFQLLEDKESTYEFAVPDRLKSVSFLLRAKIQNVSQNKKEDLSFGKSVEVNGLDATDQIEDLHLSRIEGAYVIDVLGKTGEIRPDLPVLVSLKAKDFKEQIHLSLKTDATGRVKLGNLDGIATLWAKGPGGVLKTWHPIEDARVFAPLVNGATGELLKVPYMGSATQVAKTTFSLLELRDGGSFVTDRLASLTVKDGFLELKDLPAGDYSLSVKDTKAEYTVRVAPGEVREGWVLSPTRYLQLKNRSALQIASTTTAPDKITIQLANAGQTTRVHIFATRFVPEFSPYGDLALGTPGAGVRTLPAQETVYESGRTIGDEYRYIIDRKYAAKFPGNMLTRPALLLNPWAIRKTDTGEQLARAGEDYRGRALAEQQKLSELQQSYGLRMRAPAPGGLAEDLDFLAEAETVALNLQPDDKGIITLDRKLLGTHQEVHIVAVDPFNTVYRELSLAQPEQKVRDLRMRDVLDSAKHFTEQKQVTVLAKGESIALSEAAGSNLESYDSLGKVYRLYATLHPDATLAEFSFLLTWPTMKEAEKREKYSKYACHELSFFLYKKDPVFFQSAVLPYLKNKKDKTFLDHWLLGDDLAAGGYTQPWAFEQLNTVERILLAQRVAGEAARTARHIKDRFDLIPPNLEQFNHYFDTAVKGSALDKSGSGTLSVNGPAPVMESGSLGALATPQNTGIPGSLNGAFGGTPATPSAPRAFALKVVAGVGSPAPAAALRRAAESKPQNFVSNFNQKSADAHARDGVDADYAYKTYRNSEDEKKSREELRLLYLKLDKTMEWVENNYYHLPIEQQNAALIGVDGLWKDYAALKAGDAFLSRNLPEPVSNFTEMMFALSVLDLPFEAPKHDTKRDNGQFTLTAGGPVIAFHKEIKEAAAATEKTPILVSQNYFRYSDRYSFVDNERTDKYVNSGGGDEFLTHIVYGCQVVVTNPTSSRQKLDTLMQLPKGAMPVLNAQYTRGLHLDLQPYETRALEYAFYFPGTGDFPHYPVQVAKNEKLVASAAPTTLKVVDTPSKIDTTSWDYISQNGTTDDVLTFLKAANIERINLEKIAWRMKDADAYQRTVELLRDRHLYQNTLWSYSLSHDDPANIREFLQHQDGFLAQCGPYLDCKLLTIDPVIRKTYQFMEYAPLVNARAHRLGKDRQIVNERQFQQYESTLNVLRYHPKLTDEDLLAVTYYLLLQDRIEDGLTYFKQVNPKNLQEQMQYDYLAAYTAFYSDNPASARAIAEKYRAHPVDRWRNLFANILSQVDEIQGQAAKVIDKEDRNQQQNALATTEPTCEFKVEAKKVVLTYKNLPEIRVNYYLMDLELMFSQNPFLQQGSGPSGSGGGGGGGQFSMIKPNDTAALKLDPAKDTLTFDLPAKFLTSNVMVEIVAAGQTHSQAYYANSLGVQLAENYGQLTVSSDKTTKVLPKAYVKVYARMKDGRTRFYKDGYTDLRGKFDYTSLNTDELDNVDKFSLLILTDTDGAIVREAAPPKR